jgi:hypothetical protein
MNAVVNLGLARRRRRLATLLSIAGIVTLVIGLFANFQAGGASLALAYSALILGSVLSWAGVSLADTWVRPPRADEAIGEALKGASAAYGRFHWSLPADHVLVAPWGLAVAAVFNIDGPVTVQGQRWRDARPITKKLFTLGRQPVRNPEPWLEGQVQRLAAALTERDPALAELPIRPLAIFTHKRVELAASEPNLPAITLPELRDWLRGGPKLPPLAPATRRALDAALAALAAERLGTDKAAAAAAKREAAAAERARTEAAAAAEKKEAARAERRAKRQAGKKQG